MFTKELVFLDKELETSSDVLHFCFQQLRKLGYVKQGYLASILEREEEYPTGLMTHVGIHIAMPHTEADLANKEGIVFIRTKNPVKFRHMVDPDEEVEVQLIFNIVVKEPSQQIVFLTKLMTLFQSEELLNQLLIVDDSEMIVALLTAFIGE